MRCTKKTNLDLKCLCYNILYYGHMINYCFTKFIPQNYIIAVVVKPKATTVIVICTLVVDLQAAILFPHIFHFSPTSANNHVILSSSLTISIPLYQYSYCGLNNNNNIILNCFCSALVCCYYYFFRAIARRLRHQKVIHHSGHRCVVIRITIIIIIIVVSLLSWL